MFPAVEPERGFRHEIAELTRDEAVDADDGPSN
jgi:hypothetical protein